MAEPEHIAAVQRGADGLESWRLSNPDTRLDLDAADLSRAALCEADLAKATLRTADLRGANLDRANISDACLSHATLWQASLRQSSASRADFFSADLSGADLGGADLRGANLFRAKLGGANLANADLTEADLSGAHLARADLSGACLSRADLGDANLSEAKFADASLRGANLRGASLFRTDLDEADLANAWFLFTSFSDVDVSRVKGLSASQHLGPSNLDIHTLVRSQGKLPVVFLRGCGIPDSVILGMPTLMPASAEFHSAYVVCTREDESFARRLHDELQTRGVRCWVDFCNSPSDVSAFANVDREWQRWDKVLLCASRDALTSLWVNDEIDRALASEQHLLESFGSASHVIIPLDLDGYLIDAWDHPEKASLLQRTVVDFRKWNQDPAEFQQELDRLAGLLRIGLRASTGE